MLDLQAAASYNAAHADDVDGDSDFLALLVEEWQRSQGLAPDGRLGPVTRSSLETRLRQLRPAAPVGGLADVVARALQWVDKGEYKLGAGALYTAESPFAGVKSYDAAGNQFPGFCDCSGFVAWAHRYRRGRFSTDGMVDDAYRRRNGEIVGVGPQTRFRGVAKDSERVLPGYVITYPGPDLDEDGDRDRPGHCGVIVAVHSAGGIWGHRGWHEEIEVAHCTPRRGVAKGAIRRTDATLWWRDGVILAPVKA